MEEFNLVDNDSMEVQVHSMILTEGQKLDSLLLVSLMYLYSCSMKCDEAWNLFDKIPYIDFFA